MDDEKKLTEDDIRNLLGIGLDFDTQKKEAEVKIEYHPEKPKEDSSQYYNKVKIKISGGPIAWILNTIKTLSLFIIIFTLSFTALNYPALWLNAKYFLEVKQQKQDWSKKIVVDPKPISNESFLIIPKIAVKVPVTWNVPSEETLPALEKGVAHFKGTALPGEVGNVFISGHSSYYWWNEGGYKEIFALLGEMQVGDKITIDYRGTIYNYEITETKVVKPEDIEVLDQPNDHILSLMTCVPVGTNLNRLIVIAKQI